MKIHENPSRISCIMMAAIAGRLLERGPLTAVALVMVFSGGGKCKDEREVNDEDSTFVVLVTV